MFNKIKTFKKYKKELENSDKDKIIRMMYNLSKTIDEKYISKNQIKKQIRYLNKYKGKALTQYDEKVLEGKIFALKELLKTKHSIFVFVK